MKAAIAFDPRGSCVKSEQCRTALESGEIRVDKCEFCQRTHGCSILHRQGQFGKDNRRGSTGEAPASIARSPTISSQTLRNHLHHINQKLRTHNRLEAVMHAIHRKLI